MIKKLLLLFITLTQLAVHAQQTLQVLGKNLLTASGQTIVLRGINYPIIDDGNINLSLPTSYQPHIDEAALTGANAIRLAWYTDGVHWRDIQTPGTINGYVNNGHLNNIIAYCIAKNMIPILEIHVVTCTNDWNKFNTTVMNFWNSAAIQSLIQNNKTKLIINLANEMGYANWSGTSVNAAMAIFQTNYNAAIANLRALNINVPIMIDAPDCGTSSTELLSVATSMNNADPRHNLIFSAHTYWGSYANTFAQVQTKLNEIENTNVCFVLGEVATNQDNISCGDLDLSSLYPYILTQACSKSIGWLAWNFNQDCSPAREMTNSGLFANLTTFGNDIVYNNNYGFKSAATCQQTVLAMQLLNFNAVCTAEKLLIKWATANEENVNSFILQKTNDSATTIWNDVATINCNKISTGSSYSYAYVQLNNKYFYRLKILDNMGAFTYSPIVSSNCTDILKPFYIYTNTAGSTATVHISVIEPADAVIKIFNPLGQIMQIIKTPIFVGSNSISLSINFLPSGIYFAQLTLQTGNVQIAKFIKN